MVIRRRRNAGQVLMVALVALILVGVAASLLSATLGSQSRMSLRNTREVQLIALADAALAEALATLAREPTASGVAEHEFEPGMIASKISRIGGGRVEVVATARIGTTTRRVRAEVHLLSSGPAVIFWQRLRPSHRQVHQPWDPVN